MVVTIVGAGNVATSLAPALCKAGHRVAQVWSRSEASAKALAQSVSCPWTTDLDAIDTASDVIVISVADCATERIASALSGNALTLHTAGSIPLSSLPQERAGVLYPLGTFTKAQPVDLASVPIYIEAKRKQDLPTLEAFALSLSPAVSKLDSQGRMLLHLSAVFACNFANHCYTLASEALQRAGLPFGTILPLIDQTARRVHKAHPRLTQTGPAQRRDKAVMDKHLALLSPADAELYRLMSESIERRLPTR